MMIMLSHVMSTSRNIDNLIKNVENFMQTKVYFYNCFISKYIWINYGVGIPIYFINIFYSDVRAHDLVTTCDRILYLMLIRIVIFIVKIQTNTRGLSNSDIQKLTLQSSRTLNAIDITQIQDCCAICINDF